MAVLLSSMDTHLFGFRLTGVTTLQGWEIIKMIQPWSQMGPNCFLMVVEDFPIDMVGTSVSALVDLRNEEMT